MFAIALRSTHAAAKSIDALERTRAVLFAKIATLYALAPFVALLARMVARIVRRHLTQRLAHASTGRVLTISFYCFFDDYNHYRNPSL